MVRSLYVLALCALPFTASLPVHGQGALRKGFDALAMFDYFKARSIFQKEVRKRPAGAWYGLSVISGRADNPFFQLDSAYAFIQRADAAFTAATDRQRAELAKVKVDHTAILAQRDHVFQLAWEVAKGQHTIAAYDQYIRTYLQSPRVEEATIVRDHLAFQEARAQNTAAAYRAFLERYPRSREVFEARTRLEEAIYRETTATKDLAAYLAFIQQHPESPHVRQAEEEVFRLYTPRRTVEEYRKFIVDQPRNHRVPDAWRSIYEIRTRDLSAGAITRFLQEFPEYPFVEELVDDYRTANLVLLPFRREGRWGFIDDTGVERIKAEYDWVEEPQGGQALVGLDGLVGTVNRAGRQVIPLSYEEIEDLGEGSSAVERGDRVGVVDNSGELVVPMVYEEVGEFSKGMAYAAKDGKYGYINARGDVLIPFQFSSAGTFRNGLAVVAMEEDGAYGVIDTKGNVVVAPEYDWVEGFEGRYSRVRKGDRMGLMGPFGDVLLAVQYEHVGAFRDGLALVVQGRKAGYINESLQWAIPLNYEAADGVAQWGEPVQGLMRVQQSGRRCLIDTTDRKVLPCQFAEIGRTSGALIPVRRKNKWGYADKRGTVLFEDRYDQAWEMAGGLAKVRRGDLFGAIDSTGKEVVPVRFSGLGEVQHDHVVINTPEGQGLLHRSGREVIAPIYERVEVRSAKVAKVMREDHFGYIDLASGRFIWREEGLVPDPRP